MNFSLCWTEAHCIEIMAIIIIYRTFPFSNEREYVYDTTCYTLCQPLIKSLVFHMHTDAYNHQTITPALYVDSVE